ncbi:MAG TPA: dihydroorotase, partial [Trebonia sp.]|nr:dihydroorotase [Trebonia sp.]
MTEEWLIKGVSIAGGPGAADIHLDGGEIVAVGADIAAPTARVLDAQGLIALPGLVDLHTHLREPGSEDAETVETGTR